MAQTAETFAVSADGFSFPVTDVLTGRGFVTGKSGSGKSNTASVIAEELLERDLPLLIVDTDGEYFGLKERYELLHVGGDENCELSVDVGDADRIATLALEENLPIILDVSGFPDEETGREVVGDVVEALFRLEKSHTKPFLLLVEEAHEFIPQQGASDDLSEMLIRVAKRGRKRGLGICALSQRPAAVDKDYITQCDWLVWHRLTWENDTEVAERILGEDGAAPVQSLDDGEALVLTDWDESLDRVQFRRKRTYDAGATPDVEDSRRSAADRSELIDELSEREWSPPTDDDGEEGLPVVSDPETIESAAPVASTQPDSPAESTAPATPEPAAPDRSATEPAAAGPSTTEEPVEPDPLWELGYMVIHCYRALVSGHRRLVARLARLLAPRLEALGSARTPHGRRRGPRSARTERLARLLAVAVLVGAYLALVGVVVVAA